MSALKSGVEELADNSPKLVDGAGDLLDGSDELVDGVEKLKDGSEDLRDGMKEFNEEGIQKLAHLFDADIDKFVDRFHAIQDAGTAYQSFAGISDDMSGKVKFIIKTDSITTEE